jgi:hypothetical protein
MRKSVILFTAFAASALIAESAWARTFSVKHVSQAALAAACKKVSGNSYSQSGGVYGCAGGGGRWVECTSSSCTANVPRDMPPSRDLTVILSVIKPSKPDGVLGTGILEGGTVLGGQGPSTAGSPASAPKAPSAPPIIIR